MFRIKTTTTRQAVSALFILILVTFFVTLTNNSVHSAAKVISIAEARSLPLGTVVTIDGVVTVPSGAFSSSTFDQGFVIQDRTGEFMSAFPTTMVFS